MKSDKVILIAVMGVVAIVLFDIFVKYSDKKRADELRSQQLASQTLLQQQAAANQGDDRGFLGGLLSSIPLIGGFY